MKKMICIFALFVSCAGTMKREDCQQAQHGQEQSFEHAEKAGRDDGLKAGIAIGIPAGMVLYYLIWIAL